MYNFACERSHNGGHAALSGNLYEGGSAMEEQDKKLTLEEQELVTGGTGISKESKKKCPVCGMGVLISSYKEHLQMHQQEE